MQLVDESADFVMTMGVYYLPASEIFARAEGAFVFPAILELITPDQVGIIETDGKGFKFFGCPQQFGGFLIGFPQLAVGFPESFLGLSAGAQNEPEGEACRREGADNSADGVQMNKYLRLGISQP